MHVTVLHKAPARSLRLVVLPSDTTPPSYREQKNAVRDLTSKLVERVSNFLLNDTKNSSERNSLVVELQNFIKHHRTLLCDLYPDEVLPPTHSTQGYVRDGYGILLALEKHLQKLVLD